MKFNTNFDRTQVPHSDPEVNEGPVLVESEGYLTTEQLVNMMIKEGQELRIARAEMVDFESEDKIDVNAPLDPTRDPGFDLADFSALAGSLAEKAAAGGKITEPGAEESQEGEAPKEPAPDA